MNRKYETVCVSVSEESEREVNRAPAKQPRS